MYNATASSFTDTDVTEGVTYFYKIFAYDTSFNYASGVEIGVKFNEKNHKEDVEAPANITDHVLLGDSSLIILSWSNPADVDFSKVLILKSGSSISDAPTTGRDYVSGDSIGGSEVIYNAALSSFTDIETTEDVIYFYKIFAYDMSFNYASGVELEGDTRSPQNVINSRFVSFDSSGVTFAWGQPS